VKTLRFHVNLSLVGGFNPSEKYESKWESSPNKGENKKYLKPLPRKSFKNQFGWQETDLQQVLPSTLSLKT